MPALALADALKDFGSLPRRTEPVITAVAKENAAPDVITPPAQPQSNPVEEAVEKAQAELSARLEAEHAQAIEALQEKHNQEIARLQAELGERAGDTLAVRLQEMEKHLIELTSSVAARILGIALTEDVQETALEALAKAIKDAARDREAVRISIRGPLSLYEALQSKLGNLAERVEFTEAAGFDMTASIDDALFETRLSEWSNSLSEIMT
jgi:Lhr-like helicase